MKSKKYNAGKLFNKFLKITLGNYMKILFDYRIENGGLEGLKPPYIVIANHTNFWDPFLLSMCFSEPVYFVTSDAYFRNPVLKQLLKLVGAIPKTKLVSDPLSIRGILEVIKNNGIVGIFPEGRRNWDGSTLPLLRPTAKLIKSMNVPVVTVLFKGACLSMPRWSSSTRRGKLTMSLSKILEPHEIKQLSAEEIFSAITESLSYDEYNYQREHMNPYKGKKLAERLELFLFCCPECGSIGGLESSGSNFRCTNCSYEVIYNNYGFFEAANAKLHFDNPRDWNIWQMEHLHSLITTRLSADNGTPVLTDKDILLSTGQKTGALKQESDHGSLLLYSDRLEYLVDDMVFCSLKIDDMTGENIQFNNQFEFFCGKALYRFSGKSGTLSAYKWARAIEYMKSYKTQLKIQSMEQNTLKQ